MSTLTYKAAGEAVPDLNIYASLPMPESTSEEFHNGQYENSIRGEGAKIAAALIASLPGGVLDALIGELFIRRGRSLLRVPLELPEGTGECEQKVILKRRENLWTIVSGDRYAPELCWDEMLGLLSRLTVPEGSACLQWMKTEAQHAADRRRHEARMEALEASRKDGA